MILAAKVDLANRTVEAKRLADPWQQEHQRDTAAGHRTGLVGAEIERNPSRRVHTREPQDAANQGGTSDSLLIEEAEPSDRRVRQDAPASVIERGDLLHQHHLARRADDRLEAFHGRYLAHRSFLPSGVCLLLADKARL